MRRLPGTAALVSILVTVAGCGAPPSPPVAAAAPLAATPLPVATPDPTTRGQALSRLVDVEEERTRSHQDHLHEDAVEPLTRRCLDGNLDEGTQSTLVKLLAEARDPRGEPCFIRTLADYQPDRTEADVELVCRAVAAIKLKAAAGPLLELFTRMRYSRPRAQGAMRAVHDAMIALADPTWEATLLPYLDRPVDPRDYAALNDEMFWQVTATELLGRFKSVAAVRPLLRFLLSPQKAAGQNEALLALVTLGKPALGPTTALLRGEDQDLVDYAAREALQAAGSDPLARAGAATAHVAVAARVLGALGREDAAVPLLEALARETRDQARATLARELVKVPRSPQTIKAFRSAYEKTPVALSIPGARGGAREALLNVVPGFFDASFVPWIARTLKTMKGDENDLDAIKDRAMEATLKLATRSQLAFIDELARSTVGGVPLASGYAKEIKLAKALLAECGEDVGCYLGKLTDRAVNTDVMHFVGVKAVHRIGELGGPDVRTRVMAVFPRISHPGIRFAALMLVDATSPHGDAAIAAQLRAIIEDAIASGDIDKLRFNGPLKQLAQRLEARAAP